ncbi:ATP synthase I subunit [Melghirimyces profundicolus]|uniref:ATP synthase I subunit n=1 Tax=Melghirimyces profundicolus TaxID=1242148 RepID=A0A2T6C2H4_9BACL|nr:ATP synthase subunit I [Melghirimyces profundicolus]PTX62510.1 ATP synthase I subunit [Melghirimyces profundicolus]
MKPVDWPQGRMVNKLMSAFLALQAVLWLLTPQKPFFAGLFLGGLVGLYNIHYLARRLRLLEAYASSGSGRRPGSGMVNRFLMAVAPLLIAVRFPGWIDWRAVLIGLPAGLVAVLLVEFWDVRKNAASDGKG